MAPARVPVRVPTAAGRGVGLDGVDLDVNLNASSSDTGSESSSQARIYAKERRRANITKSLKLEKPGAKAMFDALVALGFNVPASETLMYQGLTNIGDLRLLSEKEVDEMIKSNQKSFRFDPDEEQEEAIFYPFLAIKKLKALRFWAVMTGRTGKIVDPSLFTSEKCMEVLQRMEEEKEHNSEKIRPDRPEELKVIRNWATWWEKWDNYMSQIRGAAHISLRYIYRANFEGELVSDGQEYEDLDSYLYKSTLLSGQHFKLDNATVYKELKSLVVNGPLWTYVKKFDKAENGREALLALRRQMEGDSAILTRKNQAYADITAAAYRGERANWTFAHYIAKHQQAHNELEQCEEPVPETKKVTDFLAGISDPTLLTGLSIVLSDKAKLGSFELTQQFLGTLIVNTLISRRGAKRGVSEVNTDEPQAGPTPRRERDNRGKNGKARKGKKATGAGTRPNIPGLKAELRDYKIEEWRALTDKQKDKVRKLRKERDMAKKVMEKSRRASEVVTIVTAENNTEDKASEQSTPKPASTNHGNQFGRRGGQAEKDD